VSSDARRADRRRRQAARDRLQEAVVNYQGRPVGTQAARDPALRTLNYDQVFTRDFAVSAFCFLLEGRGGPVRNFLLEAVRLQSTERQFDCFKPGEGLIPASFKIEHDGEGERLVADYGEHAIARVAPVDSGFWWLLILRAYRETTGDQDLVERDDVQAAIRKVLELCLTTHFDMFPTMLVPDGSYMIDRRMGVYGYPIDVESLFFAALRAADCLLTDVPENGTYREAVHNRIEHLAYHIRNYYWLDLEQLNRLYRYGVEEYGAVAVNKFNVYPETVPMWLTEWLPEEGGYFVGNLGPGRLDYRYFAQGNLLAIVAGLATEEQAAAFMTLLRERSDDLIGEMPLKLSFPALEGADWATLTGRDPKNRAWSYHNGGNWPVMLWLLSAACACTGDGDIIERALAAAGPRLERDDWPEYYDGRGGRLVGRQARRLQTWTLAGYLTANRLMEEPDAVGRIGFSRDVVAVACGEEGHLGD
jgi:glycogen debranching enzyme